ncbi:Cupredoxin superfamily protein [Hibiscus syriacus]|uniref:Cupredoxin superfamily protein n=1 Tax=Hibiscus syriacus TaxID=106335 RepID=A0A6A2X463_HIBSY|nr:zinc finger protein ZAT5-like [Hibiscus syriacus]KAE8669873.1 Cupredoxin superfamily protein [Hibiscus syriacus]
MEFRTDIAMKSKDHMDIVKGKRTKRSRPLSPIPFVVGCNNSIYDEDNGGGPEGSPDVEMKNYSQYLSPSSSSSEYQDIATEEEEDMANCLILLARGRSRETEKLRVEDRPDDKFTSRKLLETGLNGTGKAEYIVYECKTCNRTFPSFQALGGHRASHTKPKAGVPMVDDKKTRLFKSAYEELGGPNNKVKVHECSICGAEFTSGQALGGHMRRHRGSIGSSNVNIITPNKPLSLTMESEKPKKPRNVLSLGLDLNLPAPEDDDRESEFAFGSKQQQQSALVFSAPTLVDCFY